MLKALKKKFILINMLLVFLVISIVLIAAVSIQNSRFTSNYKKALIYEMEESIRRPKRDGFKVMLNDKEANKSQARLSFYVIKEGESWSLMTPWIELDKESLLEIAKRAQAEKNDIGFWQDSAMAYYKKDGRIAFLNLSSEWEQHRDTMLVFLAIYIGSMGLFLLISIGLSRWALKPVERSFNMQRRFVSDASHELKTPLSVILANIEIMQKESGESPFLSAAQSEAAHMKKLVDNMLFLARSDEAQNAFYESKIDISDICAQTALNFEAMAFEMGLTLDMNIEDKLNIMGDSALIKQLISILIDNATKYTPKGGNINIGLVEERENVKLSVRNSPAFVPEEELEKLFDRFYRRDEARSDGGYGLGLSIAAEIVRRHKGQIKATSAREAGTAFIVLLPIKR